jgi:hypothetical protein
MTISFKGHHFFDDKQLSKLGRIIDNERFSPNIGDTIIYDGFSVKVVSKEWSYSEYSTELTFTIENV